MKPYERPAIAGITTALGSISLCLAAAAIAGGITTKNPIMVVYGAGSLASGLFLLALGSIADSCSKAAHWAEQLAHRSNLPFTTIQGQRR